MLFVKKDVEYAEYCELAVERLNNKFANTIMDVSVHFFFLRRYNFREVLAFSTNSFHLGRFLMQFLQFVSFIFVISLFTSSSHLFLGLPSDLVSAGDHSYTFFTMLLSGIRCTCPNQASLCALMQFIFLLPISLFSLSLGSQLGPTNQTAVFSTSEES